MAVKQLEQLNPNIDITKDERPIINTADKRGVDVNLSEIPAPNASMLVRNPSKKNQRQPHLNTVFVSLFLNVSSINLKPKNMKMPKTTSFEIGWRKSYTKFVM